MSRIGKSPIIIPENVRVEISGGRVALEGVKGLLTVSVPEGVEVSVSDGKIKVESAAKNVRGLVRALIANAVYGVSTGWTKVLELSGTGFRAAVSGNKLQMSLGFSHQVSVSTPPGIEFKAEENRITVSGPDKSLVGQVAAAIRLLRPADVYKAKGFKYQGETVLRKPGKAAKAGVAK